MRVLLHVESEGQPLQTLWLRDNQCAEVGRIAWADLLIEDDPDLAEVHFALQCGDAECRVRDYSKSPGTFVNGQRVIFSQLADGDVIRAGGTSFRVQIEHDETPCPPAETCRRRAAAAADPDPRSGKAANLAGTPHGRSASVPHTPGSCAPHAHAPTGLPAADEPLCVLLRLDDGFFTDYCVWLRNHQVLQVGRSCQADFPVEFDEALDAFHFELVTDWTDCHLRTLQPNLPVFVNQRAVADQTVLGDGDIIHAGRTRFSVTIRGGGRTPGAAEDPAPPPASPAAVPFRYRQTTSASGLTCYLAADDQRSVLDVARLAAVHRPLYLVVNFAQAKLPVPACLGEHRDLFAGPSKSSRALGRLMLIAPDDPLDCRSLWEQTLGSNATIGLVSDQSTQELLHVLRTGPVSFSSPGILREQIAQLPEGFVRERIDGIAAVLVEAPPPTKWCVFANPRIVSTPSELGFPCDPESA